MGQSYLTPSGFNFKPVLLWENKNPSVNFTGQKVQAPGLQNYEWIAISYSIAASVTAGLTLTNQQLMITKYGNGCLSAGINVFAFRNFSMTGDEVSFDNGAYVNGYAQGPTYTQVNSFLIPIAIYGLS